MFDKEFNINNIAIRLWAESKTSENGIYFYSLENICEDIDECEAGAHDCLTPDIETCYNTVGNYVCEPIDPEENEGNFILMSFEDEKKSNIALISILFPH